MMPNNKTGAARRVGEAVSERMRELGHTYESLAEATIPYDPDGVGLSVSGIAKVAQGKIANPQRRTAVALERALGWRLGHIGRLTQGTTSEPAETVRNGDELDGAIADATQLVDLLRQSALTAERILINLRMAAG